MPARLYDPLDEIRVTPKDKIKLWRYMSFAKYVSLLKTRSLYLNRADLFLDPYEGRHTTKYFESMQEEKSTTMKNMLLRHSKGINELYRNRTYINCWHENEEESAAMWEVYAGQEGSIAIETTYAKLQNLLPSDVYLGRVIYLDYNKQYNDDKRPYHPFFFKRKSFEYEREVRIVYPRIDGEEHVEMMKCYLEGKEEEIIKKEKPGHLIPVDLDQLITNIHISPRTPDWVEDLVRDLSDKYGVKADIRKSELYSLS